jgi:predicted amidohydrolase
MPTKTVAGIEVRTLTAPDVATAKSWLGDEAQAALAAIRDAPSAQLVAICDETPIAIGLARADGKRLQRTLFKASPSAPDWRLEARMSRTWRAWGEKNGYGEILDESGLSMTPAGLARSAVRVAAVQYEQKQLMRVEDFGATMRQHATVAGDYNADLVVFPELFTLQLLSAEKHSRSMTPTQQIDRLTEHTEMIVGLGRELALTCDVNLVIGSHPSRQKDGKVRNIAYVCGRDGTVHEQAKIHATPSERDVWSIEGGNRLAPIPTDIGPLGVLICYDVEFPELARHLVDQGVRLICVPFCTDDRPGFLRVRTCAHARAVENQIDLVLAGNVGNLPGVYNMDLQYAQSCVLTPHDLPFPRDGIAAEATANVEGVVIADLRLGDLDDARVRGTVRNLADRRLDLYGVTWKGR